VIRRWVIWAALLAATAAPAFGLSAEEQLRFADGIYLRGFYETAVGEYLVFLRDHEGDSRTPMALFRAGECYRRMDNRVGAERFYERVRAEFPDSPQAARAALRLAELAMADGRNEAARDLLKAVLAADPPAETAASATHYLGLCEQRLGNGKAAEKAFEAVVETHGDSPHAAYAALELAALETGRSGKAKDRRAERYEQAVAAAATPSAKAEALFRWGEWAFREGRYQEAADTLQALRVELPDERRSAEARLPLAWSLYYLDRTVAAMEEAEALKAAAQDAESAAAGMYLLGNCLRKLNRDGEALLEYDAIVRNHPQTRFAQRAAFERMATHFKRGDPEQALAALPSEPEPDQAADVLWMRAESERLLDRPELARERYATLAEDYPESGQAPAALLRLGELARNAERWEEAADWFQRSADDYPRSEWADDALQAASLARLRAGDAEGALAGWEALLDRDPGKAEAAEARLQKALVLTELGRGPKALQVLDDLLAEDPPAALAARAQYWRGVLLADDEQWEKAEAALRACLAAQPGEPTGALARLRLAVVLQRQDRMDEAADQMESLRDVPARVAENPALIEWLVRHRFDQEDYGRSLAAATALAEHAPEPSWRQIAWFWAGLCRAQLGDEAAAVEAYRRAVAEDARTREGAEARLLLAALDLKAGRHDQAAEGYAAAAEAATGEDSLDLRARAYFGLGEAAEAAGEPGKAARHFMSVAVLFDDPEWTPRALYEAGRLFGETGQASERDAAWAELGARYPESSYARRLAEAAP